MVEQKRSRRLDDAEVIGKENPYTFYKPWEFKWDPRPAR